MENFNVESQNEEWLTVVQASQLSSEMGLTRTPKTIRRWAQRSADLPDGIGDVVVERRDTPFGFEYVITRSSLEKKIEQELEFAKAKEAEPEKGTSPHGRTQVDMSEHVHASGEEQESQQAIQEPKASEDSEVEFEKLRERLAEAEIDAIVHKKLNQQLVSDRETFIKQIESVTTLALEESKTVGRLEAEISHLKALPSPTETAAPTIDKGEHDSNSMEREENIREVGSA